VILVSIAHDGSGYELRTFTFTRDAIVIGRAPDADLVLAKEGVAPRHVGVSRRGGELVVEDLRTLAERQPTRALRPGDRIRVGGMTLELSLCELAPEDVADATERRFLDAIRQRPDDPETRAVYADWLEERGHARRAEFLRLQLAVGAARSATDPAFAAAAARLAELAPEVGDAWRVRVAMSFIAPETCPSQDAAAEGSGPGIGLELACPMRWDMLEPTDREGARLCRACNTEVTYCTTIAQAATAAQAGRCIAIDLGTRRRPYDLEPPRMVGWPTPPRSRYGQPGSHKQSPRSGATITSPPSPSPRRPSPDRGDNTREATEPAAARHEKAPPR
jgi:uncharacterized protein (TIGR02996 family)